MPQLTDRTKLPQIVDPAIRNSMDLKHLYQVNINFTSNQWYQINTSISMLDHVLLNITVLGCCCGSAVCAIGAELSTVDNGYFTFPCAPCPC